MATEVIFLSTLSLRRATVSRWTKSPVDCHFYPRSPCGERPRGAHPVGKPADISIHALLAESDRRKWCRLHNPAVYFYPRSPCGERQLGSYSSVAHNIFLSTLSLRRATYGIEKLICEMMNFYPRSPCGERLEHSDFSRKCRISIHALLAESDNSYFHSFSSCNISIHALLAESDWTLPNGLTFA